VRRKPYLARRKSQGSLARRAMEAERIGTMGFARNSLNGHPREARHDARKCVAPEHDGRRPGSRPFSPHRAEATTNLVFRVKRRTRRKVAWRAVSRLEPRGGARGTTRDVRRGSGFAERGSSSSQSAGGRLTEIRSASFGEHGRASVLGPRRLAKVNSPAKVSRGLRQRELHWVPSSPHRHRDARSTSPRHQRCSARAWREKP